MGKQPIATINIIDAVHCEANHHAKKFFLESIEYKDITYQKKSWARGPTGKPTIVPGYSKEITKHLITGGRARKGLFFTGLLPRIQKHLRVNGHAKNVEILGLLEKLKPYTRKPILPGITFRKDQSQAIRLVFRKQRGIIVFPTGSGKTIIAAGIIKAFCKSRTLFLCHTLDLVKQTSDEFTKFGINHQILSGKNNVDWESISSYEDAVLISTIQSFTKLQPELYMTLFDLVIVDEVHHAAKEESQYGKVLTQLLSPVRIGLTATLPTNGYQRLVVEGFFGPVLKELTPDEGFEIGILAKPRVRLFPVPYELSRVNKLNPATYNAFYNACIVNNTTRNAMIVDLTRRRIKHARSVLIMVDKIEHGKILQAMFYEIGIDAPFVEGVRDAEFRKKVKSRMIAKSLHAAICTKVWKEGINIPVLNTILRAEGLKEEKGVKQSMGRGLRVTAGKKRIELIDFLDPYRYLAEHSIARYRIYYELKWL